MVSSLLAHFPKVKDAIVYKCLQNPELVLKVLKRLVKIGKKILFKSELYIFFDRALHIK